MSNGKAIRERIIWSDGYRAIELLDWKKKPEDFDRLYEYVIGMLLTRTHQTRNQLLQLTSEEELRRYVRAKAENFNEERFVSLPLYVYVMLRFAAIPRARQKRKGPST